MQILIGSENQVLRAQSAEVVKFDKNLKQLIKEMKATLEENNGVGLAAPQVGVNQRLILITLDKKKIVLMVNPQILEFSKELEIGEEGCLSLPGVWGNVERAKQIKVKFTDEKNNPQVLILKDLNARVVQHEIDHLDGVLFIDKIIQKQPEIASSRYE